mgnify:FL=1
MSNTFSLTKEEVELLREYISLTLSDFHESIDDYSEDSEEHNKRGALYGRIYDLSTKLDSL